MIFSEEFFFVTVFLKFILVGRPASLSVLLGKELSVSAAGLFFIILPPPGKVKRALYPTDTFHRVKRVFLHGKDDS